MEGRHEDEEGVRGESAIIEEENGSRKHLLSPAFASDDFPLFVTF